LETVAKSRVLRDGKNVERIVLTKLQGARGAFATLGVLLPITLGFFIPIVMLIALGMRRAAEVLSLETLGALARSSYLALLACLVTLGVALALSQLLRGKDGKPLRAITRISSLGYALPGTVLGIGVLVPFGQFDQWINRVATSLADAGPGLLLSGGVFALVFAYTTRFLIIAVSHVEDGMEKIPSNYDHVARTLGRSKTYIFHSIHLPLLRPSIVSAMLLVFVDAMKELPATLILRPFDFETLATRVFSLASLGQYEPAAIPALLIVLAGFIPVMVLSRNLRHATSAT
jgi:iron(III) transport system permease protein